MEDNQRNKKIWLAWERHRRTLELNKFFGTELIIFQSNYPRIIKHPILLIKSWFAIHAKRPQTLIVQNPSIFLTLLACVVKSFYGYFLIVDAHNSGLLPLSKTLKKFLFIYRYLQKKADITIVTNETLANIVSNNKGNPYVLPDRIPSSPKVTKKILKGEKNILFICTFAGDEPYEEVIKSASSFDNDVIFYVTGNHKRIKLDIINNAPSNVIFTGFVSDNEYWNLLSSVDLSIDLTRKENCLVCGAYESIAVGTPMILSDTNALKTFFNKGAVFTENNSAAITTSIKKCLKIEGKLREEIKELKYKLNKTSDQVISGLKNQLQKIDLC
ncbi:MAG: glycosyltransferase [Candidatus Scalindua sp.]|jgi:glycosyltransferase involved in cell wall biosynthesis|nr:glycosyltransferase [Candidatus Scalindua sp.]MBT6227981.1 glycosyltransferase [Candidatus Scalindua sp.]MBT6561703.1 glycosyltransferase [Candidatus Scalindua sp.]MBT7211105.1 glycosyltransferase [Candidatus Scalindua sp.]